MTGFLSPIEIAQYQNQRTDLAGQYADFLAQMGFQQGELANDFDLATNDWRTQYARRLAALPGQFVNRGTMNSGLYQQGVNNYLQDRGSSYGALQRQYQSALGQLANQNMIANQRMARGMEGIANQEAANRQQRAAQIGY